MEDNVNQQTNGAHEDGEEASNGSTPAEKLAAELKDQQNKYLYLYAEFETYKKRVIKERSDLLKFGHEGLARDLLQVTDNLDRALEHTENVEAFVTGIKMVNKQLQEGLRRAGIVPIETVGEKFDPEKHEAVAQEAGEDDGKVLREHQKGYTLHGRLLDQPELSWRRNKLR